MKFDIHESKADKKLAYGMFVLISVAITFVTLTIFGII